MDTKQSDRCQARKLRQDTKPGPPRGGWVISVTKPAMELAKRARS